MTLPFDGAISDFYATKAPQSVRAAIAGASKGDLVNPDYPYAARMNKKTYEQELHLLQIELMKFQSWIKATDQRVAVVFEGRDAAGKGGTIKRFRANLNPRQSHIVALSKPSDREAGEWYFQRYIRHMPTAGEIAFFDRSWYNRGVVEDVFDFCTPDQRHHWFSQVGPFEDMLVDDGIKLHKIWLNVGRATQLHRFLARESDPLKQWKLSWIDVEGLNRWDAYTAAIGETLTKTHSAHAPWTIVRSDDKRRARLNAIRSVLSAHAYDGRDDTALGRVDPKVCGGVELWDA